MNNAIDIIEPAKIYFLLSKDHPTTGSKPILIGTRIELEFALQDVPSSMVIATSGDNKGKRCVVLVDYSTEDCRLLAEKATKILLKIKSKN